MVNPERSYRVGEILIGKLLVIRRIGGGGMGDVYEVEHLVTRHRRALKVVRKELARERRFVERLLREASIAGRLGTPFVVETLDAGWLEDESAYVLMELLDGRPLHEILEEEGYLNQRRVADLMCQVAEGMRVAHEAGIIHRDLKPENLFVLQREGGRERVKILDFGISKFLDVHEEASRLTREGSIVGTPFYMSPEQAAGKELDGRSDIWAIGVNMYEACTGRLPFDGDTVGEVLLKIGGASYVPLAHRRPDLDPAFVAIVNRALTPDPAGRFQSADALGRALIPFASSGSAARAQTISDGVPVHLADPHAVPRPPRLPTLDAEPEGSPSERPSARPPAEGALGAAQAQRRSSRPPRDAMPRRPATQERDVARAPTLAATRGSAPKLAAPVMAAPIMVAPIMVAPIVAPPVHTPDVASVAASAGPAAPSGWTARRWGAAAALSALVLSIGLLALVRSMDDGLPAERTPAPPIEAAPPAPEAPPVVAEVPAVEPVIAAPPPPAIEPETTVAPATVPPPRRRLTPAEAAGLEDNPYGP